MKTSIVLFFVCIIQTFNGLAQQPDSVIYIKVDFKKKMQVIENIGSSGCWFSEGIGKYWPTEKKERIAELLFSKQSDENGQPLGIALSAWRFNIGAGTLEQGDKSGIKDFRKRSDSFLNSDGTYDWTKQEGYRFFLQKAKDYGVETLIAFSNSPPVQYTKNGLGFKTEKDYQSNLKADSYIDYARFLTNVTKHFDEVGFHFDYVSPVNEPQWDWSRKYMEADQEGSPWTNDEIFKITKALNDQFETAKLKSKIIIPEAGMLNYLYNGSGKASNQIQQFFGQKSQFYIGNLKHVSKTIAGHSYFTEGNNDELLSTRQHLADTVKKYNIHFWQSEYSMLADGFKEGQKTDRTAMDCALFLSKVIHTDLTVGNATAWQFWNAYEPGSATMNTRYYLIALQPDPDFKNGNFTPTKNLWILGHFSRFVKPGMTRLSTENKTDSKTRSKDKNLLTAAFVDGAGKLVTVAINYGYVAQQVKIERMNTLHAYKKGTRYLTTSDEQVNLQPEKIDALNSQLLLPARSISTIIFE
ncbi:beta-glycosidase [Pedobacter yonginense]|uniref:Beta-glycosidase n=1 Tax=Pedobacter yonginense TaxID=651869 RepID=A0A317ERG5_9SPHI|nr:glycoside hydrolase [Pedobacter yonginense]PWS29284.1 beta-glycosidase [Pedobacter yonginense]